MGGSWFFLAGTDEDGLVCSPWVSPNPLRYPKRTNKWLLWSALHNTSKRLRSLRQRTELYQHFIFVGKLASPLMARKGRKSTYRHWPGESWVLYCTTCSGTKQIWTSTVWTPLKSCSHKEQGMILWDHRQQYWSRSLLSWNSTLWLLCFVWTRPLMSARQLRKSGGI